MKTKSNSSQHIDLTNLCLHKYSPNAKASNQIIPMAVFALFVVDLNLSGKQMAYHLSMDMNVRVNTETVTETVWKKKEKKI